MNAPWQVLWRRPVPGGSLVTALLLGVQGALLAGVVGLPEPVSAPERVLRLMPDAARAAHWQMLPGVGPVIAVRLERALHGRGAATAEALMAVKGVGPRRLQAWAPLLYLEGDD